MTDTIGWRRRRSREKAMFAWSWLENNGFVSEDKTITDAEVNMVADNWDLAECCFSGTQKKARERCKRFVDAVVRTALPG